MGSKALIALCLMAITACGGADSSTTTKGGDDQLSQTTTSADPGTTTPGETTTAGGDSVEIDPCSLLTVDDIEAATGQGFAQGTFNESFLSSDFAICDWVSTGDFATVQVLVSSLDSYDSQRASAGGALSVSDISIAGASDAYVAEGSLIGMRVNGMFVQVSYLPPGPGDVTEATTQLAEVVVANLG
ncbi:MAG: DUF3558 domain-containing protein [Acidimicrobiia bacterium]|nr:DUF3558 domain-containing protein [Acidimicrobiia bacterium]MDH3463918.1 DUF3558 domain-containing protein [Acidimicrobiia bacterium]